MSDIEHATSEDAPPGVGYLDINSGRWLSAPPPPLGPEEAKRLDDQAARNRRERERAEYLRAWNRGE